MPRTKRTSKTTKQLPEYPNVDKLARKQAIDAYLKQFDLNCERKQENIKLARANVLRKLKQMSVECKILVSHRIGNTALEDLDQVLAESTHFITVSDTTSSNTLSTSTVKKGKAKRTKRSLSLADDEAETSENSESSRTSRMKVKQSKPVRSSRSLSRSKIQQPPAVLNNYKTPLNRAPKNDFGFVTPKVKPNTPQVVLRRPKEGEMAISMQGSPLLVNTIVSKEANVNIPLGDGRTISIQPQYGLRMSQLPTIDNSIRRQIEVLRDNLIKVCELSK